MANKYYLHRISHEGNVSYSLLSRNILTLGWSKFTDTDILDAAREEGYPRFNTIAGEKGEERNRSRWSMWYFAQMDEGDKVVVPLYGGLFSIFEVQGRAKCIWDLEEDIASVSGAWDGHVITWKDHMLFDEVAERNIDLGFYVLVKPVVTNVPRSYVTGKLVSRMKIQTTSADITDIGNHVEKAITAGETNCPISLYEQSIEALAQNLKKQIIDVLDDTRFEKLIKWYVEKSGAEYSRIPAKNEPGKKAGADADIIADFRNLKHIIYIQAKHHEGETSDWAVHQIKEYFSQKSEGDPDYSYARWVISTCDNYSEDAIKAAKEYKVRLIDGEEFARMLIDIGLLSVDDAFERL